MLRLQAPLNRPVSIRPGAHQPIAIAELARQSGINEVTLARIRDGKATRLSTRNKLLIAFSRIYGKNFSPRNVTGIHLQGEEMAA